MADQPSLGEQAQERTSATLDQTRAQTTETVRRAARKGSSFVDTQKHLAAVELDGYACALHQTARQLHDQSQDNAANLTERIASSLDGFAHNLRERDIGDALDRMSDFARRNPALFLGGTLAAGFALSRFMKSSRSDTDVGATVKEKFHEVASSAKSGIEEAKSSAKGVYEETKGAAKEGMQEGSAKEASKPQGAETAKPASEEAHSTAADVEIPVILKPHEPEQHPR